MRAAETNDEMIIFLNIIFIFSQFENHRFYSLKFESFHCLNTSLIGTFYNPNMCGQRKIVGTVTVSPLLLPVTV